MKINFWLVVATALVGAGCGGREFGKVEGRVSIDGKPAGDVEVLFLPDSLQDNVGDTASAFTDSDGHYGLQTQTVGRAGTVLGPHRVVFVDLPAGRGHAKPSEGESMSVASAKQRRFPVAYSDAFKTPFRDILVKSGVQTLDFDLKSQAEKSR